MRVDPAVRARPPADLATHLVLHSSRADVHTVLVDGEVRVCGRRLAGVDPERVRSLLDAAREHVVGKRRRLATAG